MYASYNHFQLNYFYPRKLMHAHLTENIKSWQMKGENIVLLIDTNENLAQMGQLQSKLCYECQLIDPIRAIYQKRKQVFLQPR